MRILKNVILFCLLAFPAFGQDFWCRSEPVSANGDEYIEKADSLESACAVSQGECFQKYGPCEITGCGLWQDHMSLDSRHCPISPLD